MSPPEGPRLPAAAQTLRWAARPGPFMDDCLRRYGTCFTVRLLGLGDVVFLADPEAIKRVFTASPELVGGGEGNSILEPVVGRSSVLLLDGPAHLRERRLLSPPFHGERVRAYGAIVAEVAGRELERWPLGRPFALRPRMQAITLEVIVRAVFGVQDATAVEAFSRALARLLDAGAAHPLLTMVPALRRDYGPWRPWTRFEGARAAVDELLFAEIRRRRGDRAATGHNDVLSVLLQSRDQHGRPLSDRELRDELTTLLVAGHETTATALAWAFERLLRNPCALDRLAAALAAGEDGYLDAVVKETLRLRPVLSIVIRRLAAPMELAGHVLPAGTQVAPCIHLTHRLTSVYEDPLAFAPERFLNGAVDAYGWIPFGGGTRRCLGASFATLEMKEVLRAIVPRASLRAVDPRAERARRRAVTLAPARDAMAILERRAEPGRRAS